MTNIRYADDIVLFAHDLPKLKRMMRLLQHELLNIGLEFNMGKTKIFTTTNPTTNVVDFYGEPLDIVCGDDTHVYLGRKFAGNLEERGDIAVNHRIQLAWMKYHHHKKRNNPYDYDKDNID